MADTAAFLREAREKRGLTLDDVAQATRIPRHYLEMMEGEGDTRLISDPLYLVHYVRRYAEHLQLDGREQLAAQFIRENTRLQGSKRNRPQRKPEKHAPGILWLVLILLVLGGAAAYVWDPGLLSPTADDAEEVATTSPPPDGDVSGTATATIQPIETVRNDSATDAMTVLQPEAEAIVDAATEQEDAAVASVASPPSAVAEEATAAGPPNTASLDTSEDGGPQAESGSAPAQGESDGQRLEIVAKETAWVRVIIDGQSPQDMMMQPGDSRAWSADKQFVVTLGNAGGVDLTLNGEKLAPLGTSGQVVRNYQLPR